MPHGLGVELGDGGLLGLSRGVTDRPSDLGAAQRSFGDVLARSSAGEETGPEAARRAAERFVAQTLVSPLLKQLREQSWAAPPFAPSSGEKQFVSLQDAHTANSISRASNFPLVDRIAQDLLDRARAGGGPSTHEVTA